MTLQDATNTMVSNFDEVSTPYTVFKFRCIGGTFQRCNKHKYKETDWTNYDFVNMAKEDWIIHKIGNINPIKHHN